MGNILVFCAHPDDMITGPGGTLAKYAKEGHKIKSIVFSYEEMSNIKVNDKNKEKEIKKEAQEANKIIGGKSIEFLGLKEKSLAKEIKKPFVKRKILAALRQNNPEKVFTHAPYEPHPEHRTVSKLILDCIKETDLKCEVYGFEVWSLFKRKNREFPKLLVDTSKTFSKKINALDCLKSKSVSIGFLKFIVYFRSIMNGLKNNTKSAELFYKLK